MQLPQLHACGRRVTPQATLPGNLYTGYFGPSDALVLPTEDGIARPLHGACHLGFHNCLPLLFVCVCFVLIFFSQQRTTSGDTQLSLATPKICPKSCSLSIQLSSSQTFFSKSPQTGIHTGLQGMRELLLQGADSSLASKERPVRSRVEESQHRLRTWREPRWKQSQSGREGEEERGCCAAQRKPDS